MKQIIRNLLTLLSLLRAFLHDYRFCVDQSLTFHKSRHDQQLAQIMLLMHALEKGMSFTDSAREFGGDKARMLSRRVDKHVDEYGMNDTCVVALNVLHEYLKNPYATKDARIREEIEALVAKHRDVVKDGSAGTKVVCEPPAFDKESIETFFATRSSVRQFSDEPVTDAEVAEALHIASFTPSACNRQTSRVHVFRDRAQMTDIIDAQLGAQNWCDNASVLFVITANASYFGGVYERHQALIDGGLYAMNFVHGLHLQHIATCFKMFVRDVKLEKRFRRIAEIPANEIPIVLVLAGHYPKKVITSPKSVRLPMAT